MAFAEWMRSPPLKKEKRMPTTRTEPSTGSAHRTASRADTAARNEIIDQLKEDHRRVKKAFRDFEKLDKQDEASCEALVRTTIAELEIHAELEHMTFHVLIDQLKTMDCSDERYCATFTVLGEYIKHHVKEEEGEIFAGLSRARMNWRNLRDDMQQLRQQRMAEQGLGDADGAQATSSSSSSSEAAH